MNYRNILVPLDGSERAATVIPHVESLAQQFQATVSLVQVVEPTIRSAPINLEVDREVKYAPQKIDRARAYLQQWRDRFQEQGIEAKILLMRGTAADAILEAAELANADLLALTTGTQDGEAGLARAFHGSTIFSLINRSTRPLAIVHPDTPPIRKARRRILVPLDGSMRAEAVLPHAIEQAKRYQTRVLLLRVVRTGYQTMVFADLDRELDEATVSASLFDKLGQHQEVERVRAARAYILDAKQRLQAAGVDAEACLTYGRPADSIVHIAESVDADWIAMTNQIRSGLGSFLYSSVALSVLNQLVRPMLVVPTGDPPPQPRNFA